MKKTILAAFCLMGAIACSNELEYQNDNRTVLTLELPGTTKTVLGDAQDGVRPVLWCKGDKISVNGVASQALAIEENVPTASFVFEKELSAPYSIIYPASMVKDAATVTLPAGQKYAEGDNIVSGSMPMAGYSTTESVMMKQVCGILGIRLKMGTKANLIRYVEVTALGGEPVSGDFSVDFQNSTLSSEAKDADVIRMEVQKTFPADSANTFNVILPAGVYSAGFQVKVVDENGRAMVRSIKGSRELGAGKLMLMPVLEFVPNSEDKGVEIATPEDWNSFATAYNAGKYPDSQIATITADLDFLSVDADKFVTLGLRDGAKQSPDGPAKYFAGTLNGNGKRIMNLKSDVPFIQAIGTGALVKDVNIDKTCSFTPWYGGEKQLEFGSLIGYCSEGTVKNCTSAASITVSQCKDVANKVPLYVGGLVGRNRSANISDCTNSGEIVANATYVADADSTKNNLYIGGFTGYCSNPDGVLENCSNTGNISVASTTLNIFAGGICAKASAGTITGCSNSGAITASTVSADGDPRQSIYLGGLFSIVDANKEQSLEVTGCSNSGDITSASDVKQQTIGGIAGRLSTYNVKFTGNTTSGNITTKAALQRLFCGGVFGRVTASQTLTFSGEPCTGNIKIGATESSNQATIYCGGLIGQTTKNITIGGDVSCKSNITYDISTAANMAAESFFGGIIGCAYGAPITISGMKTSGVITIKSPSNKAMQHKLSGFGGIIGGATKGAKISDCSSSVYVKMTDKTSKTNGCAVHFGGIAGRLYGGNVEMEHCTNSGRQQNNHYNNNIWSNNFSGNVTGGIVGSIGYSADNTKYSAIIDDCHNTGSVYALRGAAGGIAGYLSNATITNCSSTEDVTRSAPGGGIAGVVSNCKVSSCYVKSNITSADGGSACADAGGIIGEAVSSSVDGCRYYGTIIENSQKITGERVFGGIIGKADDASSAGITTACGFGGTINGTTITEQTNLSTCAIGSTTGTRGNFYLWNGVLQ